MAQALHGQRQLMVGHNHALEICPADPQQLCRRGCAHRRGAETAAEERHLPKSAALPESREKAARFRTDLDRPVRHDEKRVARIAGAKQDLVCLQRVGSDDWQNLFDFFRWKMAQQIALGEQCDEGATLVLFFLERVLAEPGGKTHRRSFPLKVLGSQVVNDGSQGEAAADKRPGETPREGRLAQLQRALKTEVDGQRADQRTGGESKDAGEQPLGERQIQSDRRSGNRRRGCAQPEKRRRSYFADAGHRQRAGWRGRVRIGREGWQRRIIMATRAAQHPASICRAGQSACFISYSLQILYSVSTALSKKPFRARCTVVLAGCNPCLAASARALELVEQCFTVGAGASAACARAAFQSGKLPTVPATPSTEQAEGKAFLSFRRPFLEAAGQTSRQVCLINCRALRGWDALCGWF